MRQNAQEFFLCVFPCKRKIVDVKKKLNCGLKFDDFLEGINSRNTGNLSAFIKVLEIGYTHKLNVLILFKQCLGYINVHAHTLIKYLEISKKIALKIYLDFQGNEECK